ncbi:AAA family ATPase [Limnoglobus roseus]|uniref:ATP-binding protein n=1 Tax=Limnoglobus roseus TaxID=2598579 RepID=A0A5C1AJN6_9BACT|nr:AAA family ATPase [Limnoglobus roseus]QEL18895.1 ATP-binding protein [Limnoglobus roseus]
MNELKLESIAPFLAGFAILGTVLGMVLRGWSTIKGFVNSLFRLVVTQVHLQDEATAQAVLAHLIRTYKRSALGERTFGGKHESFRDGKFGHVPFEFFGGHRILFWVRRAPLWFNVAAEKTEEKSVIYWGGKPKANMKASLAFVRGTINVEAIVREASASRNHLYWSNGVSAQKRFFIKRIPDATQQGLQKYSAGTSLAWYQEGLYRLLAHTADQLGKGASPLSPGRSTDKLYFPDPIRKLLREVEMWRRLRDWYLQRDIPWKRGWVLYGPPGTGKSAITRAIAEDLDMPLFVYSLGQMLNEDLEQSWAEMQAHVPCIALFEDFDNVFHGRENVYGKPKLSDLITASAAGNGGANSATAGAANNQSSVLNTGRLSFDCLLNCLDGVEKSNGIFTVITTNHIEKLDPALGQPRKAADGTVEFISTRPGRIDKAIELGHMDDADKRKLARRIFFDSDVGFWQISRMIDREPNRKETPAQFQERCAQLALDLLWQAEHPNAGGSGEAVRPKAESRDQGAELETGNRA